MQLVNPYTIGGQGQCHSRSDSGSSLLRQPRHLMEGLPPLVRIFTDRVADTGVDPVHGGVVNTITDVLSKSELSERT